jgi:SNF2 family DNA or RNA helicase
MGDRSCITRSKVPLRNYQKSVIEFINNPKNDSLLVVHGTGTGKTLSALVASQCYLAMHPESRVVVISPASIVDNFKKEMKKYIPDTPYSWDQYEFYSFDKFAKLTAPKHSRSRSSSRSRSRSISRPISLEPYRGCKNAMVIVDEVHNVKSMGKRYESIYKCVRKCRKLLILTATPFVNSMLDFQSLISLLYRSQSEVRKHPLSDVKNPYIHSTGMVGGFVGDLYNQFLANDGAYQESLKNLGIMLKNKVSFVSDKSGSDFPKVEIKKIEFTMSREFYNKYYYALTTEKRFGENPDIFANGYRRAVNSISDSAYVNERMSLLLKIINKDQPTLIFTNWLADGVSVVSKLLKKHKVEFKTITGQTRDRMSIVDEYNRGEFKVLIITKAGSEGLDLKNTRNIIVLDPVWNPAVLDQIIGRGVRYQSHINLPAKERLVTVYLLVLNSPMFSLIPSGDLLLYTILEKKQHMKRDIERVLKQVSI